MTLRPIRAFREINRDLTQLRDAQQTSEAAARLELAKRTHTFTARSKKVVDETMSLSAVLMRAGEVDEATRLLAEVDREVETEKAALMESVHEVKSRAVVTRQKMTRLRMAKMMLSAVLGASLMMFSAFGVVLAKYLAPSPAQGAQGQISVPTDVAPSGQQATLNRIKHIHFAGMKIALTPEQMKRYEQLTAAGANDEELKEFLRKVLSPDLADRIVLAASTVTESADGILQDTKKTVRSAGQTASSSSSESDTSSDKKDTKQSSDDEVNDDNKGDEKKDKSCEDGSGDDEGDNANLGAPGPGCIPVINEESPI